MKICFFIANLDSSGGTERVTTVIANALVEQGYDISVVSWWGRNSLFFPLDPRIRTYYLFDKDTINIYTSYISSLRRYRSAIKKIQPEIIVDVCVPLSLITIPVTFFSRIKRVSWEHFNVRVSWNFVTTKLARRLITKFSHKVVVLTDADRKEYESRYGACNVIKIVNPVTIPVNNTSLLTNKNVLAVGRLTNQKGFDMLLKAWKHIRNNYKKDIEVSKWKMTIVGGGEDEQVLQKLAGDLDLGNSVVFKSPTKEIEKLYLSSSIFVMSSRFEGLPLALIEAKAFGLPTISFDCETGPREVISDGEDGLLVKANDINALANAMLRLIKSSEERQSFSISSIKKAKRYDLKEVVKSWTEMLNNL